MPYNSRAERYDTESNVKLGGLQSHFEAADVSSHPEELWYYESLSLDDNIYIYIYIYIYISH